MLDATGAAVAQFKTLRFGLGSFSFLPAQAGAGYSALIRLADGRRISSPLPAVRAQGYVLRLLDAGAGKLRLVVQARGVAADETLYLLGHARQQVAVAAEGQVFEGQVVFTIDKDKLAPGVSHFTVFNQRRQPLAERLYFQPPPASAALALMARTDKPRYGSREQVTLQLGAAGGTADAPAASVSVAVYQLDSLSAAGGPNVLSYLWLTSDLKGLVENPDYYLTGSGPEAAETAANLMLTQGWSRFRWREVWAEKPDSLPHAPELNGPLLRGRVLSRATGRPAAGIPAFLTVPGRRIQLYNSLSKADGSVRFEVPDFYGAQQLLVQAGDSLHRVALLSPFSGRYPPAGPAEPLPLTLPSAWAADLARRHVQAEVQRQYFGSRPVRYQAPAADSMAFYGQPSARYLLDKYTRFKVMEEVMREYVPGVLVRKRKDGFHFLIPDDNVRNTLEDPLVLLDGVPIFDTNRIMAFDPLKVQQLDVLTRRYFAGPLTYNGIVSYTTYKGDLGGLPLPAQVLLQEYEGLQGTREFYAPRYETPPATRSRLPDFRNLLYWNPDLTITPGTELTASFFTSDQAGTYRVVVQGLNGQGQAGSTSFTFEVKAPL